MTVRLHLQTKYELSAPKLCRLNWTVFIEIVFLLIALLSSFHQISTAAPWTIRRFCFLILLFSFRGIHQFAGTFFFGVLYTSDRSSDTNEMKYRETINAMNEVNRMIEYHSLVWPVASLVGTFMYDIVNEIELTDMSIRNERTNEMVWSEISGAAH